MHGLPPAFAAIITFPVISTQRKRQSGQLGRYARIVRPEAVRGGDAARHLHHLNHTARLVAVASNELTAIVEHDFRSCPPGTELLKRKC